MTKPIVFLLLATSICSTSWAFGVGKDRRAFLQSLSGLAFVAATPGSSANANPYCAAGVGEDCEDLSEGNEFIKSLQEKSAANREANLKEATLAYQVKNYPEFFAALTPPKYMVMKEDGTFMVLTGEELAPLKKAGKIKLKKATAFGGQTIDYSQKPVMTLVE